jgi:hypothetical protein
LTHKENAAMLADSLNSRMDAVEMGAPDLTLLNGQTYREQRMRPITYARMGDTRPTAGSGKPVTIPRQLEEGFTFEFTPLLQRDERSVDAVLKIEATQVERLDSVWIHVAGNIDARNRTQIQIPRVSAYRIHERFRWPADRVLVVSTGIVPRPAQGREGGGVWLPLIGNSPPRGEAVILIDYRGPQSSVSSSPAPTRLGGLNNRGRY